MIAVVESGSTKSDWMLIEQDLKVPFQTIGFNPYFHDVAAVHAALLENPELCAMANKVEQIFFYGAGCSAPYLNNIIKSGLATIFHRAEISVEHDLAACAFATYSGEPAISCIIGTGSNSCYFDGKTVTEVVPALGYILGDEGSGSYFGKRILADHLYQKLPEVMSAKLLQLGWTKDQIVNKVYREPNANVFLASFMPFIAEFRDEKYVQHMMQSGFNHFIKMHVLCYPDAHFVPVHFVGSIADIFKKELRAACEDNGVKLGNIVRKPIHGLVDYYLNKLVND